MCTSYKDHLVKSKSQYYSTHERTKPYKLLNLECTCFSLYCVQPFLLSLLTDLFTACWWICSILSSWSLCFSLSSCSYFSFASTKSHRILSSSISAAVSCLSQSCSSSSALLDTSDCKALVPPFMSKCAMLSEIKDDVVMSLTAPCYKLEGGRIN